MKIRTLVILPLFCGLLSGCDEHSNKAAAIKSFIVETFPVSNAYRSVTEPSVENIVSDEILIKKVPAADGQSFLSAASVTNGMPKAEAVAVLGQPKGEVIAGTRVMLVYDGGNLELVDGRVANLKPGFMTDIQMARSKAARQSAFEARQKAKGLVLTDGKWLPKKESDRLFAEKRQKEQEDRESFLAEKRAKEQRAQSIKKARAAMAVFLDAQGNPVDHSGLVTKGKVTVVDFYASWCEPCRQLSMPLNNLTKDDKDVVLRKIDIVSWSSMTAKKYYIRSVPNVRVFDREGLMVGPPTSSLEDIQKYILEAKNR